jgi:hypothetical protein
MPDFPILQGLQMPLRWPLGASPAGRPGLPSPNPNPGCSSPQIAFFKIMRLEDQLRRVSISSRNCLTVRAAGPAPGLPVRAAARAMPRGLPGHGVQFPGYGNDAERTPR